jgi:hypothetical protein
MLLCTPGKPLLALLTLSTQVLTRLLVEVLPENAHQAPLVVW